MQIYMKKNLLEYALAERTYQDPFPEITKCIWCSASTYPIILIDDDEGALVDSSPERIGGRPIYPHDCCSFALYMCNECGEVTTIWNQA